MPSATELRAPRRVTAHRIRSAGEALAAARSYAARVAPGAAERDRTGAVPTDELALLDRSGLLGITVPTEHGGAGLGPTTLAEVVRIVAAADPALAQVPQAHFLFVDVLRLLGRPAQQRRLFGDVLDGDRLGNALSERGGAHAQDLGTRLVPAPAGDGFVLKGHKAYATGALTARWIPVSALDDAGRLVVAFVGRDDPGVRLGDEWHAMGQRATVSGTVTLEGVEVDPALVVPYWRAFERPQLLGARAQLVHAAIEVGIAGAAVADAGRFLRERSRPFFEAVRWAGVERATDDPHQLHRLGRMATRVRAAEALLASAAAQLEALPLVTTTPAQAATGSLAVAAAKAFAGEVAVDVASELFAVAGTSATDRRLALDRHWRNARTHSVHDPADWKYHHLGAHLATGTLPPSHAQL